jgi:hypothetical protein
MTMRAVVDALAFSGVWVALAAATLTAAAGAALACPAGPAVLVLAFAGTLAVYTLDRLRDVARDRATAPTRTAFVVRHRAGLTAAALVASGVAVALLGPAAVRPLAAVRSPWPSRSPPSATASATGWSSSTARCWRAGSRRSPSAAADPARHAGPTRRND